MCRKLIFLFLFGLHLTIAYGQNQDSTRLSQLLKEREKIHQEYVFYNAQNSNFWGKKSKKDLLSVIESLKNIIRKDSEIIKEINTESLRRHAQVTIEKERIQNQVIDDRRVVNDNFYELKSQLNSLQNRLKVKENALHKATEQAEALQNNRKKYDLMLVFCGLVILGLLFYLFALRGRLNQKSQKKR